MPDKTAIKKKLSEQTTIFNSYNISRVGLFGSFARETQTEDSDIDILVEFRKPIDLFAYANLVEELSNSMQLKVDMVTVNGIKPALKQKILHEVEWIEGI